MSSGFVSGGTADTPIERDAAWLAAQQELEATRRRKAEESRQSDGRGLFETLQANKAAKEEAFAEAARLSNQFRALDADEVDFLDSVLERTRREEDEIKAQTKEGLETFRRRQEELDKKAREAEGAAIGDEETKGDGGEGEESMLFIKGKRRRDKGKEGLKGVKIRRLSSSNDVTRQTTGKKDSAGEKSTVMSMGKDPGAINDLKAEKKQTGTTVAAILEKKSAPAKGGLGLVDYGSDDDDD